jgi:hypothetical protein
MAQFFFVLAIFKHPVYIETRSGIYLGGSWSYDLGEIQDVS